MYINLGTMPRTITTVACMDIWNTARLILSWETRGFLPMFTTTSPRGDVIDQPPTRGFSVLLVVLGH